MTSSVLIISLFLLVFFLILIVFVIMFFIYVDFFYTFYLKVPMLATNRSVISKISRHIDLENKKKFYDLGSGSGKLISYIASKYPELECVGIEYNVGAYIQALIRRYFSKIKVDYQRKDFFKINLSDADVIYAYLFPGIIDRLEKKFAAELKPGTLLITNSFPLTIKKPKKIIQGKRRALDTLYIYEY